MMVPVMAHAAFPADAPDWAFLDGPATPEPHGADETFGLPGSPLKLTWAQAHDKNAVPDWYPQDHPTAPDVVLHGRKPDLMGCGYCHLAGGWGRPENAAIAGLSREYIIAQVKAFASGDRGSTRAELTPFVSMATEAHAVSDAELAVAADYFAASPRHSAARVVEGDTIPAVEAKRFVFARKAGGGTQALGERIVEVPDDFARFELRDPRVTYTAYVPAGSIAKGRDIAENWGMMAAGACGNCHGATYAGAPGFPPLAGRSPTYIVRQLTNYRTGARHGGDADAMHEVAASMTTADMVAVAAYLGSLPPEPKDP